MASSPPESTGSNDGITNAIGCFAMGVLTELLALK